MDPAADSGGLKYGDILLFLCLKLRIIPHESVHETGKFLIEIMPLMFIPAAVGLLETWDVIAPVWLEYVAVTVLSTWIVMIISGKVTQSVIRHRKKRSAGKSCLTFWKIQRFLAW